MDKREITHILAGIIVFAAISSFIFILQKNYSELPKVILFSAIIIIASIAVKKFTARLVDADVEHEIWFFQRFGFKPHYYLPERIPLGIILPVFVSLFSLGFIKLSSILTYEARAQKYRASRRFGFWSYTEMTDWHHAVIGVGGILICLVIAVAAYFPGYELLSKMATYYALSNLIPFSKLDGMQILQGSRIAWATLTIISLIFFAFALII